MKIVNLYSENFKRIKAIEIKPDGNIVYISGQNGEGKTSVLDAIWDTLEHRATKKRIKEPLRVGTEKGKNEIDLGDYIITRTYGTDGKTTLKVETPSGSIIKSPQRLLDTLVGDLSFDPWDFIRQDDKKQRELLSDLLFKLTDGKFDVSEFERRHNKAYEERSEQNRDKKRLDGMVSTILPPTDKDPTEESSVSDLTAKLDLAIEKSKNEIELQSLELRVAELRDRNNEIGDLDYKDIRERLENIEAQNKRAREVALYHNVKKDLSDVAATIDALNSEMELVKIEKEEALENASLPVDGLTVTEDGIMLANSTGDLVHFCQASSAQQLRVALAIAMEANPDLRVIRIADGSLLDDNSLKIIEDMAGEKDFQIWIEYASRNNQDRVGIFIEDGMVKND
jgi:DNA repair exonuclease SbcCD ATPase subunit